MIKLPDQNRVQKRYHLNTEELSISNPVFSLQTQYGKNVGP